jgi:hypothetical protein
MLAMSLASSLWWNAAWVAGAEGRKLARTISRLVDERGGIRFLVDQGRARP